MLYEQPNAAVLLPSMIERIAALQGRLCDYAKIFRARVSVWPRDRSHGNQNVDLALLTAVAEVFGVTLKVRTIGVGAVERLAE